MAENKPENVDLSGLKIDRDRRRAGSRRRKRWLHLLWLLAPLVLYLAYTQIVKVVAPATKVRTATARLLTGSQAAAELVATGYVVAQVKAAVASKATGRLALLNVEEGDRVLQGDVLAILENEDIKANLDLVSANLEAARAESTLAAQNFERQRELIKTGSTTEDRLEAASAEFRRAAANVKAAAARLKMAQVDLENTYIRAPFDGTVLMKHADPGEMVAPFASASSSRGAVVTLADMRSLEVEADVSESNIQKVKLTGRCEIVLDAYPDRTYSGYVKKIVPTADRSRATVPVKIAFKEVDERVLPGMSARVNLLPEDLAPDTAAQQPIVVVPKEALTSRNGARVVFVVANGEALAVTVQVGRELGDVVEIRAGVGVGDRVVLSPPGAMISGAKIDISE